MAMPAPREEAKAPAKRPPMLRKILMGTAATVAFGLGAAKAARAELIRSPSLYEGVPKAVAQQYFRVQQSAATGFHQKAVDLAEKLAAKRPRDPLAHYTRFQALDELRLRLITEQVPATSGERAAANARIDDVNAEISKALAETLKNLRPVTYAQHVLHGKTLYGAANHQLLIMEKGRGPSTEESYAAAVKAFDRAIQINPDKADAYYLRGLAKWGLGNRFGAHADFNTAARIEPDNPYPLLLKARAIRAEGNPSQALSVVSEAITLARKHRNKPVEKEARRLLAEFYAQVPIHDLNLLQSLRARSEM